MKTHLFFCNRFPQSVGAFVAGAVTLGFSPMPAHAQVLFQQFTYPTDAPPPGKTWWQAASEQLPELAKLGVWGVWNPVPVKGGSGAQSMGYDPYDLYDLGSKNQKGTVPTHFGTKNDYLRYVAVAHANGLRVISDVVLNHTGGADRLQENPIMARLGMNDVPDISKVPPQYLPENFNPDLPHHLSWTFYAPVGANGKPGGGRFPRDYKDFHPSEIHPDRSEPYHKNEFLEDYCHFADNNYVARNLENWSLWFRNQTGVDGFRLDAVKIMEPTFLDEFARKTTNVSAPKPAATAAPQFWMVGEFWDTNQKLLGDFQTTTHRQMKLFDFGLFYALWDMTEKPGDFDMHDLLMRRLTDRARAVPFVSNHDVDRFQPINRQKRALPYAIIMAMDGQPSVFYRDYFGAEDKALPSELKTLIAAYNRFAVGPETVRLVDKSALVIEREQNLLACFNSGGADNAARTVTVQTAWKPRTVLRVAAASENADTAAKTVTTNEKGEATVTVPSGGFVWLVPNKADDKTNPDRFAAKPLPTTQVWEMANDLDTGELGQKPLEVPLTLAVGSVFSALLDAPKAARSQLDLLSPSGRVLRTIKTMHGAENRLANFRVPQTGTYHLRVSGAASSASGTTPAKLRVMYRAPARL